MLFLFLNPEQLLACRPAVPVPPYWEILGKYHGRLEALAERACDEYLGAPIGQADPRNAAAAIAAIREDAKLLRLAEFVEKSQKRQQNHSAHAS